MTDQTPDQMNPEEEGPLPNLLMLKIIVVGLGVMLLVAAMTFVFLWVTVGPKDRREAQVDAVVSTEASGQATVDPEALVIDMVGDVEIVSMEVDGDTALIHVTSEAGPEVLAVDLSTGELKTRITFE